MAARKVLTRAETQAQTREDLVDAAERLFTANGYHATSIAAVAAEAGRTVGAVYSNFANKEDLCVEVLRRRSTSEVASLVAGLAATPEDADARMDAVAAWWSRVSAQSDLVILIAEYLLSILRDLDRRAEAVDTVERVVESAAVVVGEYLPGGISMSGPAPREAAKAIISTGTGLAISQAAGLIEVDESVAILTTTFRLWVDHLVASAH